MREMWIDPPSGWRYGFPKKIPLIQLKNATEWLIKNGYPSDEVIQYGDKFYYRLWEVTDEKQ